MEEMTIEALHRASREAWSPAGGTAALLRAIPELGLAVIGPDGSLVHSALPLSTVQGVLQLRWKVTLDYIAGPAALPPGEYLVCVYDGWREYSAFVPEDGFAAEPKAMPAGRAGEPKAMPAAGRRYVPFTPAMVARYAGRGSAGEPRFMHDPAAPELYPVLPAPVITYSRHVGDRAVRLIPDAEFLADMHLPTLRQVAAADAPFASKPGRKVYWRGSAHNHARPGGQPPRAELMAAAARLPAVRRAVDAQYTDASCRVAIADQLKHRYLLDLDGAVNAWCGLFWKLASRSVVLRFPSPWEEWFYPALQAGKHYIHVSGPEQLPKALQWAEAHPADCEAMARAATELVAEVLEAHERARCDASVRAMRRFLGVEDTSQRAAAGAAAGPAEN
jgi:hypothetical protein